MKKAIHTTINGRKTFIGKHIGDTLVREFEFSTAVLWQNESLSFDYRLLEYAKENDIKTLVFSDPAKRTRLQISLDSAIKLGEEGEHGEEKQWYIPMSALAESKYYKTLYISEEVLLD